MYFFFCFKGKIGKWEKKASAAFDSAFEVFLVPCDTHAKSVSPAGDTCFRL